MIKRLLCMRITIDLEDQLFRGLNQGAARLGTTLRESVNEFLRRALVTPPRRDMNRFRWKTGPRGRVQPGVRLYDRESLFDLMDGR